ncbi:hypothetical protein A5844_001932 [Enterococcus sp. 10A9_DIV0425]|uniref:Uncharacterized protein n=1 Tax=Candidatus Enterococcus wittei TaxID=1987383 RepID=A0A242JZV0_9ENTE|nr:hypothetical protein [Enterococcus sp. 10A9_DIV0425]OTP10233.1 hypothetical protein A5844_001932 [Enterococcus sp. 10A9_DIV0425]
MENQEYTVIGEVDVKNRQSHKEGISKKIFNSEITIYPVGTYKESQYRTIGFIPVSYTHPDVYKRQITIYPVGTYKESQYRTIGFIQYEEKEYIAVKKRKINKIIFILIILLLALGLGIQYSKLQNQQNQQANIDPQAEDYQSQLKRPDNIDDSKIVIPGYGTFTLKKGSDTIDTVLFNPENNPCFFKFTLIDKNSGELLYESKLVAPGKGISPVKLNKKFDEVNVYEATLLFQTFDLEDTKISYNSSNVDVKINVVE